MAVEYKLSYTAEDIDERLRKAGNAILSEQQKLSEAQKAQARGNIDAVSADDVKNIVTEALNSITNAEEVAY